MLTINGYDLYKTCGACPEQYDVYKDGKEAGYLRLRHGTFRVDYPDVSGEVIYVAFPKGDGMFEEDERDTYLNEAIHAIDKKIKELSAEKEVVP